MRPTTTILEGEEDKVISSNCTQNTPTYKVRVYAHISSQSNNSKHPPATHHNVPKMSIFTIPPIDAIGATDDATSAVASPVPVVRSNPSVSVMQAALD
jgi:hypothetical protein